MSIVRMLCRVGLAPLLLADAVPSFAQWDQNLCSAIDGAIVVTEEGDYLGRIANKYDSDSIFNRYGTYGSRYSTDSVWNDYGSFGSKYSNTSARNKYASSPPVIIKNKRVIGRLTVNPYAAGAVNPIKLGVVCYDYEPD